MRDKKMSSEDRFQAAKATAPYVHPKLANVDHKSSDGSVTRRPTKIGIVGADDSSADHAST